MQLDISVTIVQLALVLAAAARPMRHLKAKLNLWCVMLYWAPGQLGGERLPAVRARGKLEGIEAL